MEMQKGKMHHCQTVQNALKVGAVRLSYKEQQCGKLAAHIFAKFSSSCDGAISWHISSVSWNFSCQSLWEGARSWWPKNRWMKGQNPQIACAIAKMVSVMIYFQEHNDHLTDLGKNHWLINPTYKAHNLVLSCPPSPMSNKTAPPLKVLSTKKLI